jgi:vacuolar-type H+-ATPase subunit H
MFWLKWNPFYFNALLIMLAIAGLTGFIWLKRWRKKIRYRNLFHKLVNQPELAREAGVKYPPMAQGIAVKSLEEILRPQIELIKLIEMVTETANVFDNRYWPAIERYAQTVHLLPASASDHHDAPGGLLHHGLEVGLYTMQAGEASLYGKDMETQVRQASRERWLFACFLAGLCHDLGKAASDVRVTTDAGQTWPAQTTRLIEWAEKSGVKKYYADWEDDRHKVHESFTQAMLSKVLTDGDRDYIGEIDKRLLQEMVMALTPSSGSGAPSMRPYNIRDMVQKADSRSVREDHKQSRTPADLGIETRTPMARHYTDGMQQLFKEGKWQINQPGGGGWALGPAQDLYLAWPRCGMELYDYLVAAGVQGVPKVPEVIAETLAGRQVILPASDGGYYWRIKVGDLGGAPLTVVRIRDDWAHHLVGLLPPGLGGMVESDEEMSSWSYVEPGGKSEQAPEVYFGKVVPLRQSHETTVTYPEATMEKDDLDRIMGEPVPGNPGPEAGKAPIELPVGRMQPPEADKSSKQEGWLPIIITVFFHVCLIATIAGAILIYMKNQIDPEVSYKLSLWMMMGSAMDTGLFVKILLLGLMGLGIIFYFRRSMQKVKQEEQKAGEIIAEAQEILDEAKKEAIDSLAAARREGGEIKKTAKDEAAAIRVAAKEEVAEVRERAKQEAVQEAEAIRKQAESDAAEVRESAERDAKGKVDQANNKMNELWFALESKALKENVPLEKLPELLKAMIKADKEAEAMIAQAEIQAKESAENIIDEARAQAEEIIEEARDQARKETEEFLRKARVQVADILDQARAQAAEIKQGQVQGNQEDGEIAAQPQEQGQVNEDQPIQEASPGAEPSPDKEMNDLEARIKKLVELKQHHDLSDRQARALKHILEHGIMTIQDFEHLCPNVSRRTLQADLKVMVDQGLLISEGATNLLKYQIKG